MNDSTTKFTVIPDRWAKVQALQLKRGSHGPDSTEMCVMEAVAYVAGERWSDRPVCACPIISSFLRSWNDALPNDVVRDRLLKPLIPRLVGSRAKHATEQRRAFLVFDWILRTFTPRWLDLIPELAAHAAALRGLAEITDGARIRDVLLATTSAAKEASWLRAKLWKDAKWIVMEAAWIGAGIAVRVAAREAAGAAMQKAGWWGDKWGGATGDAWMMACQTSLDAMLMTAASAAMGAAPPTGTPAATWEDRVNWEAVTTSLVPTIEWCQDSAVRLIERMLAVGEHT